MTVYGYHRTSTTEQHLDRGIKEISEYCEQHGLQLKKIYTDQQTGKNFHRPRWQVLKEDILRKGDILIVTELDRLGRNKSETLSEIRQLSDNDVRLMVLELPTTLMDLSILDNEQATMMLETINHMMIELYASMAQAEMHKRVKRQTEGILTMKERGEWDKYGRPRTMSQAQFAVEYAKVQSGEEKPFECIKRLGLTKPTFYRYRKNISTT